MKYLAFFGAFNPPTRVHLELAALARDTLGLDRAILVPSQQRYIAGEQHKDFAFSDETRLAMLRACCDSRMEVEDWELHQTEQPRTYHTLCALRARGKQAALLIGADKLEEMEREWLYVPQIAREFGIICLTRGSIPVRELLHNTPLLADLQRYVTVVETPEDSRDISSSRVRALMAAGAWEQVRALVPEAVYGYISLQNTGGTAV